jgi:hypothetical protein
MNALSANQRNVVKNPAGKLRTIERSFTMERQHQLQQSTALFSCVDRPASLTPRGATLRAACLVITPRLIFVRISRWESVGRLLRGYEVRNAAAPAAGEQRL